MRQSFDAIVVGARCAGASTAMLLARLGLRVLMVDKAAFPSDIAHGHFIHRQGPRLLQKWGILERIVKSGCPASTSFTLDTPLARLEGKDLVLDGVAFGYGPRRSVLDRLLIEASIEAGVEFRQNFRVESYVVECDRVAGIRGKTGPNGTVVEERAAITIGADGRSSGLARTVRPAEYACAPTLTCWYFSYWSDVPTTGLEIYARNQRVIFVFPTSDDLMGVFVAWPISEHAAVSADVERHFNEAIDLVPDFSARLRSGRRAEPFRGAANLPNFLRKPYGPGWALVGDAGCHKDPYLALGICDAFRDAELLAEAIGADISGDRSDTALADYERLRNASTIPDYEANLARARFEPPTAEMIAQQRALIGDQQAINRYFLTAEGMLTA